MTSIHDRTGSPTQVSRPHPGFVDAPGPAGDRLRALLDHGYRALDDDAARQALDLVGALRATSGGVPDAWAALELRIGRRLGRPPARLRTPIYLYNGVLAALRRLLVTAVPDRVGPDPDGPAAQLALVAVVLDQWQEFEQRALTAGHPEPAPMHKRSPRLARLHVGLPDPRPLVGALPALALHVTGLTESGTVVEHTFLRAVQVTELCFGAVSAALDEAAPGTDDERDGELLAVAAAAARRAYETLVVFRLSFSPADFLFIRPFTEDASALQCRGYHELTLRLPFQQTEERRAVLRAVPEIADLYAHPDPYAETRDRLVARFPTAMAELTRIAERWRLLHLHSLADDDYLPVEAVPTGGTSGVAYLEQSRFGTPMAGGAP